MKKILPLFAALADGLSLSSWTASPEEGTTKDIRSVAILCDSYSTFENCVVQDTNAVWYYSYKQDCTDVDSVSQTWWRRFLDDTGLRLTVNNSFSGATIGYTGYNGEDYCMPFCRRCTDSPPKCRACTRTRTSASCSTTKSKVKCATP